MNEKQSIIEAIQSLENQRLILGDVVVDTAISSLKDKIKALEKASPTETKRKYSSVLFADVVNFTKMSESMDAEEVNDTINKLWVILDKIILDHGGYIDKHIGDAIMAIFGVDQSKEKDPFQAITAALDMQKAMLTLPVNKELKYPLRLRVGINTGALILSQVGSKKEFTAMGDTVNIASRLEHACPIGEVLVSEDTHNLTKTYFNTEKMDLITVKGKQDPIQTFLIKGKAKREFYQSIRGVEGVDSIVIGREKELLTINSTLEECRETKQLRFLKIVGEAGVGKTSLLKEFVSNNENIDNKINIIYGRAFEYEKRHAFSLLRSILSNLFNILESDSPDTVHKKLEEGIPPLLGTESLEYAHFIGHLAGFDFSDSPFLKDIINDQKQIHDIATHYFKVFIQAMSPVMLIFDDMQWADKKSISLLKYFVDESKAYPIFILVCIRPSIDEKMNYFRILDDNAIELSLENLERDECAKLLQHLINTDDIPDKLINYLVSKTEGNPYYLEELTKTLQELNIIHRDSKRLEFNEEKLKHLKLPTTLFSLLQSKIELFSQEEQDILKKSSIIGSKFWDSALFHLGSIDSEESKNTLMENLNSLYKKSIIDQNTESSFYQSTEYQFRQTLAKEVVYESILLKKRKHFHGLAARWLINRSEGRAREYASIIAEHFDLARDSAAAEWYFIAGEAALKVFALNNALYHLNRAQELNKDPIDPELEIAILFALGKIYINKSDHQMALKQFRAIIDKAGKRGDTSHEIEAYYYIVNIYDELGEFQKTLDLAAITLELTQKSKLPLDKMRILISQAKAYYRLGSIEKALKLGNSTLDMAIQYDDKRMESEACLTCGMAHMNLGNLDRAIEFYNKCIKIEESIGDRSRLMAIKNNMAIALYYQNSKNLIPVIKIFSELIETAKEVGSKNHEMSYHSNIAEMYLEKGDVKQAEESCIIAIDMVGEKDTYFLSDTYKTLANSLLKQKRMIEATIAIEKAKKIATSQGNLETVGVIWRVMAEIGIALLDETNDKGFLEKYPIAKSFEQSVSILKSISNPAEQVKSLSVWSEFERKQGKIEKAEILDENMKVIYK